MTEIKNWIKENYPEEIREKLREIHLSKQDLKGELTLKQKDFPKLERIFYDKNINIITPHNIWMANILKKEKPEGLMINYHPQVELLEYTLIEEKLEELYPSENRENITKLDLTQKGLRGKLDLSDFTNLEELKIELSCPWHLRGVTSNYITDLDLSSNTKLKKITLTLNPVELNLNIFENLEKLEELNISQRGNYTDKWVGSLESINNLPLTKLNISENLKLTDWKYLPSTITDLNCRGINEKIYKELKSFAFDVKAWKMVKYPELVKESKQELIKELNNKLEKSHSTIKELNQLGLTNDDLLNQIEILESKNRELLKWI